MSNNVFTKNFILLFVSNFLVCVSFYMLMPVLPAYAMHDLHIDASKVGFVVGIFSLSAVIMRPFFGTLLDKYGRMPIYLAMLVFFALCSGGYVFSTTLATLFTLRVLHGISWSGVNTASSTIVADIIPANLRGQGIGYFGLSMTVAMAIGPAIGVLFIGTISYNAIFIICMITCLSALFASSFIKMKKVEYVHKKMVISQLFESRVFGVSLLEFFYGFVYATVLYFSTLLAIEREIKGMGAFFIVFAIFVGMFRPYAGKIMDKHGPKLLCSIGFSSFALGCLTLSFSYSTAMLLLAAALAGLGSGLIMPTLMTMVINIVPANRRGAANATFFTALDLGIGLGAIFLGFLADIIGYGNMFLGASVFLIVPAILFFVKVLPNYYVMKKEIDNS